ncbi:hypothetical protein NON00_00880 [Roseomonas sp. GC11]|uniref:hypothetical protein n=1 Tax=Roseomonas sp. GC11 TaxID=2950546 RepID=UPI00210BAD9D|nr:hypothetical protein [Roseomonas sp. GC11]MCQ4158481.1 hypothetical protein [Roseomonas sp. GC11]
MKTRYSAILFWGLLAGPALAQPRLPDPSFDLVNNTPRPVEQLFVNPAAAPDWGHDRLGSQFVPPGALHRVRLDPRGGCLQDIRVVFRDGAVQDMRGADTCALRQVFLGPLPPPKPPAAPELRLENRDRRPVSYLFISPAGQPDWGQDLLAGRPLRGGGSLAFPLPPGGCIYDVKVVYADGAAQEQRGVDLCARPAVRFP